MRLPKKDNLVRSDKDARNGHQNGITGNKEKVVFFKTCKSPQEIKFFEFFLKFHPTKHKNTFENSNHISFVT